MIKLFMKALMTCEFIAFFLWELVLANFRQAADTLRPLDRLRPGIVAVPLDVTTDWQILILSNLVALTPGSLSLDVSSDRRTLYVHAMNAADPAAVRRNIKQGFERRVKELLS